MPDRIIKYTDALREATDQMMTENTSVFVIGLGVSYPKGADGTTTGLKAKYPNRVFDSPVSEAGVTGMAVGAAITGLHPLVHHGRVEFALLASDALFTQAAKWNYMFGGNNPVPLTVRIAVGRQWGNGPQHTQSLYGLFGSVLGLKVVIPATPKMAKGLLISALRERNPVIILEPRWLYQIKEEVPEEMYATPLDKARVAHQGKDVTVIAYGDGFVAAHEALTTIGGSVSVELIDIVSINPVDYNTVLASVKKPVGSYVSRLLQLLSASVQTLLQKSHKQAFSLQNLLWCSVALLYHVQHRLLSQQIIILLKLQLQTQFC